MGFWLAGPRHHSAPRQDRVRSGLRLRSFSSNGWIFKKAQVAEAERRPFLATATEECCPARGTLAGHFTRRLSPSPMPGKRIQQQRAYLPLKRSSPRPQFYRSRPDNCRAPPGRRIEQRVAKPPAIEATVVCTLRAR